MIFIPTLQETWIRIRPYEVDPGGSGSENNEKYRTHRTYQLCTVQYRKQHIRYIVYGTVHSGHPVLLNEN